ncbi:hypothetical protein A2V54_03565 [candidate division WWE3 bacterium RBG_19FT_COMBO_53_11]|uniref:DUF11 domain-containing protein n=1 Tax=candidate division WWE3 bacterium RBG_19FT_COMBO_53_11 TaxID=1802613 RepID=A0A1F4UIQ3_UNCKA|nr:MAG: hypothetical protein A2V54_03565 [candidate division WWE3 bacterium RBG_19FT_COMBO_53_11]
MHSELRTKIFSIFTSLTLLFQSLIGVFSYLPAPAYAAQEVCPKGNGWTSHIDVNDTSYAYDAPDGWLISEWCYKAARVVNQGVVDPPQSSVTLESTVENQNGQVQDISHASFLLVPEPEEPEPEEPEPEEPEPVTGSIWGYKYDEEENGLEDWTIFIDLNESGDFDEGDLSTSTNGDGYYTFEDLEPGGYTVSEVIQDGWTWVSPNDGFWYVWIDGETGESFGWSDEDEGYTIPGPFDFVNRLLVLGIGVVKDSSTDVTAINTLITYTIIVSNTGETTLDILVTDDPPEGFTYVLGSATVDGVSVEPIIDVDGNLIWLLADVGPDSDVTIIYDMLIEDFVEIGTKENTVTVSSGELKEVDPAEVLIEEDGEVLGCTDPEAENYDPEANQDDESCEYPQEEEQGEVLGAEVLPDTGTPIVNLLFAALVFEVGLYFRRRSKKL